jgi:hypothetical protein
MAIHNTEDFIKGILLGACIMSFLLWSNGAFDYSSY